MCGIVGIAGPLAAADALERVAAMNATVVHRGPDDEGLWATGGFSFGMRRLSIIDLAGGHQPIWADDGTGIVLNGEIYNYRVLRDELAAQGVTFRTHSDTEVVLHLYRRDGLACLNLLEGMFAVALYDPQKGQVHLARDRLGKKPLYYAWMGRLFLFASEVKAIFAGAGSPPSLDRQSLHHYLTLRYVPAPATIWQEVKKLEPAHTLTLDLTSGDAKVRRYWQVHFQSELVQPGRDYLVEFEQLFLSAVEKRLVAADVPVGTLLSGGLDSSAVSAAAVELGHRDFHTFSVAFAEGGEFDETPWARDVAVHTSSRHHEVTIGQRDFIDFLPQLVRFTDEPLADLAAVPLYYVCRLAHSDVKVVLSGEGADEVLAGYSFERMAVIYRRLAMLSRVVPGPLMLRLSRLAPTGRLRNVLADLGAHGIAGLLSRQARTMTHHWSEEDKRRLWRSGECFTSTDTLIRSWYAETSSDEPIDQLQDVFCRSWLVEDLLMKADRMSMASSLELRVPFLDHALVEWAARLPLAWKVGDSRSGPVSKRILREFCRRRLPDAVLARPKRGFPVPAYGWLAGPLAGWASDFLGPGCRLADHFDQSVFVPVLRAARRGDLEAAHRVWVLLIAEHWMRAWL